MKPLPPSAVLAGIVCNNSDGDVLHDIQSSSDTEELVLRVAVAIADRHGVFKPGEKLAQGYIDDARVAVKVVLVDIICNNSDGDVLHDLVERCAKCGRELKGEAALVGTEEWCHSCADMVDQAAPEPLTWLAVHKNCELSFNGWDENPVWQVHSVNGGRNDREWTLIATGSTPEKALRKAMTLCK